MSEDKHQRNKRNLAEWAEIAWNDNDWDWSSIIEILAFKLTKMSIQMAHGISEGCEKRAGQMNRCVLFLQRIIDDDYETPSLWWRGKDIQYEDYMRQQDFDFAMRIMSKHIFRWWD